MTMTYGHDTIRPGYGVRLRARRAHKLVSESVTTVLRTGQQYGRDPHTFAHVDVQTARPDARTGEYIVPAYPFGMVPPHLS